MRRVWVGGWAVGEGVGARGEGDVCEYLGWGAYGGGTESETEAEVSYLSVGPDRFIL